MCLFRRRRLIVPERHYIIFAVQHYADEGMFYIAPRTHGTTDLPLYMTSYWESILKGTFDRWGFYRNRTWAHPFTKKEAEELVAKLCEVPGFFKVKRPKLPYNYPETDRIALHIIPISNKEYRRNTLSNML